MWPIWRGIRLNWSLSDERINWENFPDCFRVSCLLWLGVIGKVGFWMRFGKGMELIASSVDPPEGDWWSGDIERSHPFHITQSIEFRSSNGRMRRGNIKRCKWLILSFIYSAQKLFYQLWRHHYLSMFKVGKLVSDKSCLSLWWHEISRIDFLNVIFKHKCYAMCKKNVSISISMNWINIGTFPKSWRKFSESHIVSQMPTVGPWYKTLPHGC